MIARHEATAGELLVADPASAIAFLDALELGQVDLLGYSLGGMIAQEIALLRPRMVRRLVLAGTGPLSLVLRLCLDRLR